MSKLREQIEKYGRDVVANTYSASRINEPLDKNEIRHFDAGFTAALDLLWPCVESALKAQSYIVEGDCDECGTFSCVRYEVVEAVKVIKELKAKVMKGDGERDGA